MGNETSSPKTASDGATDSQARGINCDHGFLVVGDLAGDTMKKIQATTFVICPIGTTIELYTDHEPTIGQEFDVRHIDTKKIVQRAKVTKVDDAHWNKKQYHVLAEITQVTP